MTTYYQTSLPHILLIFCLPPYDLWTPYFEHVRRYIDYSETKQYIYFDIVWLKIICSFIHYSINGSFYVGKHTDRTKEVTSALRWGQIVLIPVRLGFQLGLCMNVSNSNFLDPKVGLHSDVHTESELDPSRTGIRTIWPHLYPMDRT